MKRNCPVCNSEIEYKTIIAFNRAIKNNKPCLKCIMKVINNTPEMRAIRSNNVKGNKNPMRNPAVCESVISQFRGKSNRFSTETLIKMSNAQIIAQNRPDVVEKKKKAIKNACNKPEELERRRNTRIAEIEKNKLNGHQLTPAWNPVACDLIDEYGKKHGYNFQHARNGGEVRMFGFYLDGYDSINNVAIEYHEYAGHHTEKQMKKDALKKETFIKNLHCEYIVLYDDKLSKIKFPAQAI